MLILLLLGAAANGMHIHFQVLVLAPLACASSAWLCGSQAVYVVFSSMYVLMQGGWCIAAWWVFVYSSSCDDERCGGIHGVVCEMQRESSVGGWGHVSVIDLPMLHSCMHGHVA
jgi:hypothetical protein